MKSAMMMASAIALMAVALSCYADLTSTVRVTAQVVKNCTAIGNDISGCSPATLRFQSTLSGSATILTDDGSPTVEFVGPPPEVRQTQDTLTVSF